MKHGQYSLDQEEDTNKILLSSYLTLRMIRGVMEDKGLFPGCMKFAGAGGSSSGCTSGVEKSPISLFKTIPVERDRISAPNG